MKLRLRAELSQDVPGEVPLLSLSLPGLDPGITGRGPG